MAQKTYEAVLKRFERDFGDVLERRETERDLGEYTVYADNALGFFTDILEEQPWEPRQTEIIQAVQDNPRVAVRSGHSVGKGWCHGGLALRPPGRLWMNW
jgi:hypothetical protein